MPPPGPPTRPLPGRGAAPLCWPGSTRERRWSCWLCCPGMIRRSSLQHWPAGVGAALRCLLEAPAHMCGMHTCAPAAGHCTRARERCTGTEPHLPPLPPYPPPKRACTPAARRRGPAALLVKGRATGACVAAHEALIVRGGREAARRPACQLVQVGSRTNTFDECAEPGEARSSEPQAMHWIRRHAAAASPFRRRMHSRAMQS